MQKKHTMNRHHVKSVVCTTCETEQTPTATCVSCGNAPLGFAGSPSLQSHYLPQTAFFLPSHPIFPPRRRAPWRLFLRHLQPVR